MNRNASESLMATRGSDLRVLAVYSHPDDEGQATGAMASFIASGAAVTLVCATRGEVGEISDASLATAETLGYVRELELRAAMAQIGLSDVRFLPFRDSGMAGAPENDDPRCLHQQTAEVVAEQMVAIIRECRPHIVITWSPDGGYGHPDHVAVHRHMVSAFDAAGDAEAFSTAGTPWAPEQLYWGAFTMKRFAVIFGELERRGLLPDDMDDGWRERMEKAMGEPDPPVSVILDCGPYIAQKGLAASMHRSQFGEKSLFARIPDDLREKFAGEERFYRARPAWPDGADPVRSF